MFVIIITIIIGLLLEIYYLFYHGSKANVLSTLTIQGAGIQRLGRAAWILPIKVEVVVAHLVLVAVAHTRWCPRLEMPH